jgi:hypothetical protein
MSNDILSKVFTTTRALELEYRKLSLPRESETAFDLSTRIEEAGPRPVIAELACFADALWQ